MALGDLVGTTQHFTLRLNPLLPLSPQLHALRIVLTSPGRRLALDLQQELLNCPGAPAHAHRQRTARSTATSAGAKQGRFGSFFSCERLHGREDGVLYVYPTPPIPFRPRMFAT